MGKMEQKIRKGRVENWVGRTRTNRWRRETSRKAQHRS
jgi:hypothetical protein